MPRQSCRLFLLLAIFSVAAAAGTGALDSAFSGDGRVFTHVSQANGSTVPDDGASAVAVGADGRIVAVGSAGGTAIGVTRHLADGTLDATFGTGGKSAYVNPVAPCPPAPCGASAGAVAIQSDGKVVVAGGVGMTWASSDFLVLRYDSAGQLDVTFSGDGVATISLDSNGGEFFTSLAIQPDGKIVLGGSSNGRFTVMRLLANGSLDPSFNGTGANSTLFGNGGATSNYLASLALQPDGRIVAVGTVYYGSRTAIVTASYSASGSLESSDVRNISADSDYANAVAIQPDGKVLVGGMTISVWSGTGNFGYHATLARFTSPGVLDPAFASGGLYVLPAGAGIVGLRVLSDGKIVALISQRGPVVLRFLSDGTPDASFGSGGRLAVDLSSLVNRSGLALAVQPDGRYIVAGTGRAGGPSAPGAASPPSDFALARIDPAAPLALSPSRDSVDFGAYPKNTTTPVVAITVTNTGATSLSGMGAGVEIAANGWIAGTDCATLAPGASCTVWTTMTARQAGPVADMLTVWSLEGPALAIPLSGNGEISLATHYYHAILLRPPDDAGKAYWNGEANRVTALGAAATETWFAMAQAFFASAEYLAFNRDNSGFITDLYRAFVNRAPDSAGIAHWKGQLDSGMPREVLLATFMFAPEFMNLARSIFGNTATRAEVDTVMDFYRGLLARLPDDIGFGNWVQRFRAAQCQSAAAVTAQADAISSAFTLSGEYAFRSRTNAQYVGDLYNAFLRRGGDLQGVQFWIDQIATGARTREQVRQAFVGSSEFQTRVNAIIAQGCQS